MQAPAGMHLEALYFPLAGSQTASNFTAMPCTSSWPSATSFLCTMTSSPPPSGMMKPKAFSTNHIFTLPVRMPSADTPGAPPAAAVGEVSAPRTFLAMFLFLVGSQPCSKLTRAPTMSHWPSTRALLCTKMSSPPPSGSMKPMPRSSTQALTTPAKVGPLEPITATAPGAAPAWPASTHFSAIFLPLFGSQPSWYKTCVPTVTPWTPSRPLLWMKTSSPSSAAPAGRMKPMPRSSYHALMVPGTMPVVSTAAMGAAGTWPLPPYWDMSAPAPLPSMDTAPVTFFAILFDFMWSQLSSNITGEPTTSHCPSRSELLCTKASSPPFAGAMKPMPRSSFHVFTMPVTMWPIVLVGWPRGCITSPGVGVNIISSGPPLPAPLASAGAAPVTFFATLLFFDASQLSSKTTGLPTNRHTPSTS
mmetsp:Transcript_108662/g.317908  ORF Transcript_108662/g.317908 Transcript_108662/m.317908 type:complete len:417 (+) Transcript_108662:416-1666(+)